MMRHASGSNDHPHCETFLQLYRLLSTYSLVKPPKGASVEGAEILSTLLEMKDVEQDPQSIKARWKDVLDNIIDQGSTEVLPKAFEVFQEHQYDLATSSDFIISYVSGYIIRRCTKFSSCQNCFQELSTSESEDESNAFILMQNRGNLIFPSKAVVILITALEEAVMKKIREQTLHSQFLLDLMEDINSGPSIPLVGCEDHKNEMTERILQFYLTTRLHFICKQANKNSTCNKTKELRKISKI